MIKYIFYKIDYNFFSFSYSYLNLSRCCWSFFDRFLDLRTACWKQFVDAVGGYFADTFDGNFVPYW